jgi:hypothetical protein
VRGDHSSGVADVVWDQGTCVIAGFIGWLAALTGVALVTVAIGWTLDLNSHTEMPSATTHVATGDQSILAGRTAALMQMRK